MLTSESAWKGSMSGQSHNGRYVTNVAQRWRSLSEQWLGYAPSTIP